MIWNILILAVNIVWFNNVYGGQSGLEWYIYNNSITTNVTINYGSLSTSQKFYEAECFDNNYYHSIDSNFGPAVSNGMTVCGISSPISYDSVNNIINETINLTCHHSLTNAVESSCNLLLYLNTSLNFTWSIYYGFYDIFLDTNASLYAVITTSSAGLFAFNRIDYENNTNNYGLFLTKNETNTNQGAYNLYTYRFKPILSNYGYSNYVTGNSTTIITLIISYTNTSVVTEGCCCVASPTSSPTPSPSSVNMLTIHSSCFFLIMLCIILI